MLPSYHAHVMTGRTRIPSEEIERAVREWGGNLSAAAEALGINVKNLRERCARLGLDLEAIRSGRPERSERTGTPDTSRNVSVRLVRLGTPGATDMVSIASGVLGGMYGLKSAPGTLPGERSTPTVSRMATAAAPTENETEVPIRGIGGPPKNVRVPPAFL